MPILTLGFFCLQLDRGNIANAITDKFMEDVGIDQDQFNVGQQMLSLGIVLFEIPSNMILYRVGPGKWLTLQLFLFGFVSLFQAFQHGYGAFIATRFLLGVTESGFIPGGLWTLSTWYTRKETAKRVMFFYFGNQFGQASSKLLAYGILHMRGVGGKPGWFWLFAIMGSFTVFCGFIYGFLLPDSFRNPHSTFLPFVRIFNEREVHILRTRVLLDDPAKGRKKKRIGLPAFKKAVCHNTLPAFRKTFRRSGFDLTDWSISSRTGACGFTSSSRFATTARSVPSTPTRRLSLAALASLLSPAMPSPQSVSSFRFQCPSALVSYRIVCESSHEPRELLGIILTGPSNTNSNKRGETVMAGLSLHLLGYVFNRIFTELRGLRGVRYFGVVWTQTFGTFPHPLNIAWMSLTCTDSEERALAMAM